MKWNLYFPDLLGVYDNVTSHLVCCRVAEKSGVCCKKILLKHSKSEKY